MRLLIAGRSMSPTLQVGDVVSLVPLERPPRAGDIVAFGADPIICHRVLLSVPTGRRAGWLLHAGDHFGARVGMTRSESVIGRVELQRDPRPRRLKPGDLLEAGRLLVARVRTRLSHGRKSASAGTRRDDASAP
ncbi:MAG: S26 family signal peptidase [Sandaracinaceae bacterium]|nr:MAG: S26 family signal peptidase [Sandaracinaceae bacterium]